MKLHISAQGSWWLVLVTFFIVVNEWGLGGCGRDIVFIIKEKQQVLFSYFNFICTSYSFHRASVMQDMQNTSARLCNADFHPPVCLRIYKGKLWQRSWNQEYYPAKLPSVWHFFYRCFFMSLDQIIKGKIPQACLSVCQSVYMSHSKRWLLLYLFIYMVLIFAMLIPWARHFQLRSTLTCLWLWSWMTLVGT